MKNEEGPQTPFKLAQHIRGCIPEIFEQCGLEKVEFGGWRLSGGVLVPCDGAYEYSNDLEIDAYFYRYLLKGWLKNFAYQLGKHGVDLISPLLLAWDELLCFKLEDARSGES